MGTLVDFRASLRLDLNDPAGGSQRFADADLDRAVTRAVAELSLVFPFETDTEHTAGAASRTISLTGGTFTGLTGVSEVEFPYGAAGVEAAFPPALVPFRVGANGTSVLVLSADVPAATSVLRVRWQKAHLIDAASSTVPVRYDPLLALGAAGFACLAYSSPAADNFRYEDGAVVAQVDDTRVPVEWRTRGLAYLAQFRAELGRLQQERARTGRPWVSWGQSPQAPLWPVHQFDGGREP